MAHVQLFTIMLYRCRRSYASCESDTHVCFVRRNAARVINNASLSVAGDRNVEYLSHGHESMFDMNWASDTLGTPERERARFSFGIPATNDRKIAVDEWHKTNGA